VSDHPRVTILGAGFAGMETAFLLRMRLRDHVAADPLSPSARSSRFRPNTTFVPFGADPDDLVVHLSTPFRRHHVDLVAAD